MRISMIIATAGICGAFCLLIIFGGCDHADRGIFAQISEEERIEQANEGENGAPFSMVKVDALGTERYYVAALNIFWRNESDDGSDWNEIRRSGELAVSIIDITVDSETIILVATTDSSSALSRLYRLIPDSSNHRWSDNLFNDENSNPLNRQIVRLLKTTLNGAEQLIAVITGSDANAYELRVYDHKSTATIDDDTLNPLWENIPQVIDGDAIRSAGNDYLIMIDSTSLYCVRNNAGAPTSADRIDGDDGLDGINPFEFRRIVTDSGAASDADATLLGGIYVHDGSHLYVTTGHGEIYLYREPTDDTDSNGGAICASEWEDRCENNGDMGCWEQSSFNDDATYIYTDLTWYDGIGSEGEGGLVIGVRNGSSERILGGYREIIDATIDTIGDPSGTSYGSALLRVTSIRNFFVDAGKLFALTEGRGIWRGIYASGEPTWFWDFSR